MKDDYYWIEYVVLFLMWLVGFGMGILAYGIQNGWF